MQDTTGFIKVSPVSPHVMVLILAGFMSLFSITPVTTHAAAPITPSGLNTQVNLSMTPPVDTTQYDITGGTRPGGGQNLFHSFGDFDIPNNSIANFLNDTGVPTSNILGRVTGGNVSDIYGTIQTTGFGNANLFLMNPAGFLFGPNATVNVGGMVAFTGADYLRLSDNARFNAIPNAAADALLTPMPVAAFGFLGSNPGAITVQGSRFTVTDGQSISLVGGNIAIGSGTPDNGIAQPARLSAPNGSILLASVASLGEFDSATLQPRPNVAGTSFASFGSVTLRSASSINVSGENTVSIRGGQFVLSVNDAALTTANMPGGADSITLSRGSSVITSNAVTESGADLQIAASKLEMDGASLTSSTTGGGAGGNILASISESISLLGQDALGNPSRIRTETSGGEVGGTIQITSPRASLSLTDRAAIETASLGESAAGNILIDSSTLNITGGAGIGTSGSDIASSGNLDITAHTGILLSGNFNNDTPSRIVNENHGFGGTGTTTISTDTLSLDNSARILSDTFFDFGDPTTPKLSITATSLTLSNDSRIDVRNILSEVGALSVSAPTISLSNQSVMSTVTGADGNAGPINLSTNNFSLSGGSQVISSTSGAGNGGKVTIQGFSGAGTSVKSFIVTGQDSTGNASGIFTTTTVMGKGGDIDIATQSFTIQNGGVLSAKTSGAEVAATGGSITVDATNAVILNNASITASSTGSGNAGSIDITAGNLFSMTDSSVTTEATQSGGGAIKITTDPSGTVQLTNSMISASVLDGTGGGGSVNIDPQFVILANSHILATATQGAGGNIFITTNLLLLDGNSAISASSQFGQNGTVTIQSPNAPISGQIHPLGKTPLLATALLNQQCASVADGQFSSFTVAGRNSLPAEPGSWLTSPLTTLSTGMGEGLSGLSSLSGVSDVVRAGLAAHQINQTDQIDKTDQSPLSLRQIAPAGFLTQAFAVDRSAGCTS